MTLVDLRTEFKRRSDELTRKQNENALLIRQMDDNTQKLTDNVTLLAVIKDAIKFLEEVANSRRGAMKGKIEGIVSDALRLIYGQDYRVEMGYTVKNNRSSLDIEMVRKTPQGEVRREIGGFGGGVADTISVPLRLMVLLGAKQNARVCVLDECYKHVDMERIELVAEFLKVLADRLNIQILMCTHHDVIRERADVTFSVAEKNGTSEVTRWNPGQTQVTKT